VEAISSRRCRGNRNTASIALVWVRVYIPTITFSIAVMLWKSRMFWNVRAMPSRTTIRGLGGSGLPSKVTEPKVGL